MNAVEPQLSTSRDRASTRPAPTGLRTVGICIGAQKAGTTWLHQALGKSEDVHASRHKEIDYWSWSVLNGDAKRKRLEQLRSDFYRDLSPVPISLSRVRKTPSRLFRAFLLHEKRNALISWDLEGYWHLLLAGYRGQEVAIDFSPSYELLPTSAYRDMVSFFDDVRVLYLLRDPVDRLWSNCQHVARRSGGSGRDASWWLERVLSEPQSNFFKRSRYDLQIARLESVCRPDQVHYEFFETLFSQDAVDRVATFLDVRPPRADLVRRVNAAPKATAIPEKYLDAAKSRLEPAYRFVQERFGSMTPAAWR